MLRHELRVCGYLESHSVCLVVWLAGTVCVLGNSRFYVRMRGNNESQLVYGFLTSRRLIRVNSVWITRSKFFYITPKQLAVWFLTSRHPLCVSSVRITHSKNLLYFFQSGLAFWLERRTRDRKVASSNPGRSSGRIFFSRVNFLRWLLFGVRSTPCYRNGT